MARGQLEFGGVHESDPANSMAEALAAFGLQFEEGVVLDEDEYWLWPENEEAFLMWCALQTQWTVGMAGAVGLNYAGVESCLRLHGVSKKTRSQLFGSIQAMERVALEEWAAKR
ncbi:DUF1799 domain-containing protein [Massilia aerilata]|uniref:DUF1799 domain-containing protein n=1 Tax=Massilia aerilata TaxID=453817 RepID=A0ABW0RU98_9BURK